MHQFPNVSPETAKHWLLIPGDWRRPNAEGQYEILWDRSRSYGQVWPRPHAKEVAAFYDLEAYYTHQSGSDAQFQTFSLPQRVQTKLSWWADKGIEPDRNWWSSVLGNKKLRILEVGCGNGSNLSVFRSLGHDSVGVEPDAMALTVARKEGHKVFHGTAEALPAEVSNDRFDVVVFMHVLEHCVDPFLAVKNAVGLLNSGGRFVAEVPNNDCHGSKRFGELWHWLDVPRHLNFFTETSLSTLISASGLSVGSIFFRGYCRQFSADWKKTQSHIASTLGAPDDKRVGRLSYWRYLFDTAWSEDRHKYDSVCIVGELP